MAPATKATNAAVRACEVVLAFDGGSATDRLVPSSPEHPETAVDVRPLYILRAAEEFFDIDADLGQPRELRIFQRGLGGSLWFERTFCRAVLRKNSLHLLESGLPLPHRQGCAIQGKAVRGGKTADDCLPETPDSIDDDLVSRAAHRVGGKQDAGHLRGYEPLNYYCDGGPVVVKALTLPIGYGAHRPQ